MSDIPWDDPSFELHAGEDVEPAPNPRCARGGAELAIKRMEPSALIWHGDGAAGWDKWGRMHRAPGRWANDAHSRKSQITRRR